MIITRYLVIETFKNQCASVIILFSVFFCQKLVRILNIAVDGTIPINLVLSLLLLGLPEIAQIIFPISLFLGILLSLNHMHTKNEILAIYSCGLGKGVLINAALILSIITMVCSAVNINWLIPWSLYHQEILIVKIKSNPKVITLVQGRFKSIDNGNSVLFIKNIKGNGKEFQHIFLAKLEPKNNIPVSVITANCGHITLLSDGSNLIKLYKGTCYEGTSISRNFRITDFDQYQVIIKRQTFTAHKPNVGQMTIYQLWCSQEMEARAELHWRLTLILSILIMSILVVPLSLMNVYQNKIQNIFPAMLLYLMFFLIQTSLRSNGVKGKIDPMLWMWATNIIYLAIALALVVWDCTPVRRLRERAM
ncbi:LPS export ABC transporter permease LptF [Candidatus Curculioniphilus buchneri]|uniref:LPS export ABC transporter permease LptF n=1 Tax=Candidatus Curculioniphilus buchneri TaxID=690594 RepID=UPI00376ED6BB